MFSSSGLCFMTEVAPARDFSALEVSITRHAPCQLINRPGLHLLCHVIDHRELAYCGGRMIVCLHQIADPGTAEGGPRGAHANSFIVTDMRPDPGLLEAQR